ncbi:MAG: UDP-3-O-(3-hydroxymyristoyl)glucosamine N-acyltransferase [Candidatus Gerdarchaeota archaeon]|nr:MAG: UDP-3-O-(3-hydroxymyristoyl)glucosamine N-acyltransferase [Candidatus Gerdarchaeota archaeon]
MKKIQKKLFVLSKLINGEIDGDKDVLIKGTAGIKQAKKSDITFVDNEKYLSLLETTSASAVVISKRNAEKLSSKKKGLSFIYAENPSLAFSKIVSLFASEISQPKGIHSSAVIGRNVELGKDITIQACVVIEDNVKIGARTVIYPGVYIGAESLICEDCLVYPNVSIRERTKIGKRVIIHSGAVIGSDGFGFSAVNGKHSKIPQLGVVEIDNDVEIGANVTIDRARFDKTYIGKGTKIDNLVQIGHNVIIGANTIIVAQTGISGSSQIGKNVTLAGQVGVAGHIVVGDNVVAAARSGITKSVSENTSVSGFPAKPHNQEQKNKACVQRLPKLFERFRKLEERVKND